VSEAVYTVHLRVKLEGPEEEWEVVAELLRSRISRARGALAGEFRITSVEIDEAPDS